MNTETLLTAIMIPFITTFLGGFAGWFFGRKRQEKETKRIGIDNIDAAIETWQKVVNALENQVARLLEQRQSDGEKIEALSIRIKDLQEKVDDLQMKLRFAEKLEKKVIKYEKLLTDHGIAY